jgi:hypothetical protein
MQIDKSYLAEKHTGMRVSVAGLLGRIQDSGKIDNGQRYMIGEMVKNLKLAAENFYQGNISTLDEFFQLYALDENRPSE